MASVGKGGKYGHINQMGIEIIPLVYDYSNRFSEGLAAVKLRNRIGYVGKNGQLAIPLRNYMLAGCFCDGKAPVREGEPHKRSYFIDRKATKYMYQNPNKS